VAPPDAAIPPGVEYRLPRGELVLDLQPGEFVIFIAHFEHGFGLLVSDFMKRFFEKFGIQPHHLPANAITTLYAFISFSEGYLGLWPTINLWAKYFRFRPQVMPNVGPPQLYPIEIPSFLGSMAWSPTRSGSGLSSM
jgi:hypothetical protein